MADDPYNWYDTITGTGGDDVLTGVFPLFTDPLVGFTAIVNAGEGNDTLRATTGPKNWPNFATGANENAEIWVGSELNGGDGNDVLISSVRYQGLTELQAGHYYWQEILDGGAGDDIYILRDSGALIWEDADGGRDLIRVGDAYGDNTGQHVFVLGWGVDIEDVTVTSDRDFTLSGNIHSNRLILGAGNDLVNASGGDDTVFAHDGNDTVFGDDVDTDPFNGIGDVIFGGNGADLIYGGIDNDSLHGRAGDDTLMGGQGDDLLVIDGSGDVVSEDAGQGQDSVGSATLSLDGADYANFEGLVLLGSADLALTGTEGFTDLIGNGGNNLVTTSALTGTRIHGAGGSDTLIGGTGNDTVSGGMGRDVMSGGDGDDVFHFSLSGTTYPGPKTRDVIVDFEQGHDHIDLGTNGALEMSPTEPGTFQVGPIDYVWISLVATNIQYEGTVQAATKVLLEWTGDGTADFAFYVFGTTPLTLTINDFLPDLL